MSLTAEMVELTKKLIEFESIESKPDQLKGVIDFVETYLKNNTPLDLKRFEVDGKHSLVGIFPPADKIPNLNPRLTGGQASDPCLAGRQAGSTRLPTVFFHNHLDVVPGDPSQFKPFVKGNKLYGRGASDTKGNGAVLMVLAKELSKQSDSRSGRLRESRPLTPGVEESGSGILKSRPLTPGVEESGRLGYPDVGFMFTTDEEIGGHRGTKYLLEKGYRCQFFVTTEPTSFNIIPAHKGILWLKIKVKGKAAHGSRPWDGENAALKAFRGLELFYEFYPVPPKPSWQTTVNLGGIDGGDAFNKVMGECTLKLDIRHIEKDKSEEIIRRAKKCFSGSEVEIVEDEPGMSTSFDNPYVLALAKMVTKVTGAAPEIRRGHGAGDGRFYSAEGIPAVQFGTASRGLHTQEEWLLIDRLESCYRILFDFAQNPA